MSLSYLERELLEHIDFCPGGFDCDDHEVKTLFKKKLVRADFVPWGKCFFAEVSITTQGIAVMKGLH